MWFLVVCCSLCFLCPSQVNSLDYSHHDDGYGSDHKTSLHIVSHAKVNKSVVCELKGGICLGSLITTCVGFVKFECENNLLCCFNITKRSTHVVLKIQKRYEDDHKGYDDYGHGGHYNQGGGGGHYGSQGTGHHVQQGGYGNQGIHGIMQGYGASQSRYQPGFVVNQGQHVNQGYQNQGHQVSQGYQNQGHLINQGYQNQGHLINQGYQNQGHQVNQGSLTHQGQRNPAVSALVSLYPAMAHQIGYGVTKPPSGYGTQVTGYGTHKGTASGYGNHQGTGYGNQGSGYGNKRGTGHGTSGHNLNAGLTSALLSTLHGGLHGSLHGSLHGGLQGGLHGGLQGALHGGLQGGLHGYGVSHAGSHKSSHGLSSFLNYDYLLGKKKRKRKKRGIIGWIKQKLTNVLT